MLSADRMKIVAAALAFVAGVAGYYVLADKPQIVRLVALIAGSVAAVVVFLQTAAGQTTWSFVKESRVELRKVVWPGRKDTARMTLTVLMLVVVASLFLWFVDWGLSLLVRILTGQGA